MNILKKIICLFVILILTNCANYKVDKSKIELEKKFDTPEIIGTEEIISCMA